MPNALARSTSPYLLQHADNPVDWYPWGTEALLLARQHDRPILLSIGYSACHWCHVMAHESFEHAPTAALMNELFVNIKVDREERPDLDRIYQLAHQLLARRPGGWPLTMFLTPDDHLPFFGGTYFPRESRYGLPGFGDLLRHVARSYRERQPELRNQNERLRAALSSIADPGLVHLGTLVKAPLDAALDELDHHYDPEHGGFTGAPKFPHPTYIERLLRHYAASVARGAPDQPRLGMALHTLRCMAEGGLHDQLGGGFARYSVDERWEIPHFEKMLYDNGPLLALYAEAAQLTGDADFARVARETICWLLRDMRHPDGAFYSSLDADSEGHEGRFYVWTRAEVEALLPAADYPAFARRFGLSLPANFEGAWHLKVAESLDRIAAADDSDPASLEARLDACRNLLLARRATRIHPARDDKVLTAWNALAVRGLAITARCLPGERDAAVQAAQAAVDFLRSSLWQRGRLLATWKDGQAALMAYLDDYAFLLDALLSLLVVAARPADLHFAVELAEALLAHFEDTDHGGFYFTAHDHEALIQRSQVYPDEALPSGNGVAAHALLRLGHWLGEPRYLEAAERTVRAGWESLTRAASAHGKLLNALEALLTPPPLLIIRGSDPQTLQHWQRAVTALYRPELDCLVLPSEWQDLPGALAQYPRPDTTTAWLCRGTQCSAPVTGLAELLAMLNPLSA
jgi:uncharacterized protein